MDKSGIALGSGMAKDMSDESQIAFEIGKISGQLRELLHSTNNNAVQLQSLSNKLSSMSSLPETVADINARVTLLERKDSKSEGEKGLLIAFLKSPAFVWIAGFCITIAAIISGRLDIGGNP